jgi:hypothetical protein
MRTARATSDFAHVIDLQPSSHRFDLATPECGRAGRGLEIAQGLQTTGIKNKEIKLSSDSASVMSCAAHKADM